jgi:hypothetical protein
MRTIGCVPVPTERNEQPVGTAYFLPGPAHSLHSQDDHQRHNWARWVSVACSTATYLVMPVLAYQVTGSSLWAALTVAVGYLPHLAGRLVLRVVGDKPDRKLLLVVVDAANAALLASVPIAFSVDTLTAPHVLAAAFGAQALFVCFDAANAGTGPPRAGRDRLEKPFFSGGSMALLTAPIFAAGLLLVTAVSPLVTVDGVSIIVSALLIRALASPAQDTAVRRPPRPPSGAELRDRPTVQLGQRTDRVHALVCALHAAAGGAFLGQFVPWLNEDLGVRPLRDIRLGLLLAVWALGARLATTVLPRVAARAADAGLLPPAAADRLVTTGVLPRATADRLVGGGAESRSLRFRGAADSVGGLLARADGRLGGRQATLVFLPASALCLLCCVVAPHWLVAAATLLAWGITYMVVVLDARLAEGGGQLLAFGLGWPAGALVAGLVADSAGPRWGLAVGVLLIAAATLVAWLGPRTADRLPAAAGPADLG